MSWESLRAILAEQREIREAEADRDPADCPRCGQPLVAGPRGGVYCPFAPGHYGVA